MRQGQQNRRGRGRNNNRKGWHHHNPLSRSFESNGPDVKIRGTPAHIAEKYMALARDAQSSGDPVLAVTDRLVALTRPYQGRVRMTLTYPALARARQILWLVTGSDKKEPLAKLLAGDTTIPAGRVQAAASLVMADRAAT